MVYEIHLVAVERSADEIRLPARTHQTAAEFEVVPVYPEGHPGIVREVCFVEAEV